MVIRQILSKEQTEYISTNWDLFDDKKEDFQVKGTMAARQVPFLTKFLNPVKVILEKETGMTLKAKFTGIRIYQKGDSLEKHIDNASQFAISITVKKSDDKDNPLVVYDKNDNPKVVLLEEGDGCYFEGMVVPHERKEVQSDFLLGIYLGYDIVRKSVADTRKKSYI
jgi:hypothetical protein